MTSRMVSAEAVFYGVIWPRQAVLIPSQFYFEKNTENEIMRGPPAQTPRGAFRANERLLPSHPISSGRHITHYRARRRKRVAGEEADR